MARRRMFSNTVIASDRFLSLSHQAQCLYFHLNLYADDEGFVQNPKMVVRILNCPEHCLSELAQAGYLISFPSGVVLIAHWMLHNTIRKDRFQPTVCTAEKDTVNLVSQVYVLTNPVGKTTDNQSSTAGCQADTQEAAQYSIDKYSLDKSSLVQYSALPLKNGSEFAVSQEKAMELQGKYPNLNLSQSFINMRNWLLANSQKQREESRMDTFITNWLNNEQNGYVRRSSYGQAEQSSEVTPVLGTVL